jgi:hypothetical protein
MDSIPEYYKYWGKAKKTGTEHSPRVPVPQHSHGQLFDKVTAIIHGV